MVRSPSLHLLCLLLCACATTARAQQVDCTVQVNYESVGTTQKDLLQDFESDVRNYTNDYKWGSQDLEQKIRCTLNIFIRSAIGENRYSAQVFIGSQRPVFGTNRNTAVVRLFDETWEFTYIRTQPLNHNLQEFQDLASVLDFYMNIVVGQDFDTYEPSGGTPFFQAAADVAHLGRSSGAKGWDVKAGSFSRLQLIDEILSPKYELLRGASFAYHFTGLDSLALNPAHAYENILRSLETIAKVRKQVDPRNLFLKSFFEAKFMEIAEIFQDYPDRSVYDRLAKLDPTHSTTYDEAKAKTP